MNEHKSSPECIQYIDVPTRARSTDIPHILDLVLSNSECIDSITHLSPTGNSDHSVLRINVLMDLEYGHRVCKYNYSKCE